MQFYTATGINGTGLFSVVFIINVHESEHHSTSHVLMLPFTYLFNKRISSTLCFVFVS